MRPRESIAGRYENDDGKRTFVRDLFNRGAPHYDRIGRFGFLGTGQFHRRRELRQAGLRPGMDVLDVACGTGAVTRAAVEILGGHGRVCGVDPSEGMLAEARKIAGAEFHVGHAEALPFPDQSFDFLSMGYALRHVADLQRAFTEYHRVLRPGGRVLILEVTKPTSRLGNFFFRLYFGKIYPGLTRLFTRSRAARDMMYYYWETMDASVPPDTVLAAMRAAGFAEVKRVHVLGLFSEYVALKA